MLTIFKISRSTLYEWLKIYRDDLILGYNKNLIHKRKYVCTTCSYKTISDECKRHIVDYVIENKIFSIKKLRKEIEEKFKVSISKRYVYKILKDNNVTRKQMQKNKYNKSVEEFEQNKTRLKTGVRKSNIDTYNELVLYIDKFIKEMNKIGFRKYFEKSHQNLFN